MSVISFDHKERKKSIAIKNSPFWMFFFIILFVLSISISLIPFQLTEANYGADGGDLLAAILTNGVPHPTGYPTYIILGHVFQKIPLYTPCFRGALLSALPASLAAGLLSVWLIFVRQRKSYPEYFGGITSSLAWATSPLFLSQAVIVEVHGLQTLFVILALAWIVLLIQDRNMQLKTSILVILASVYGLGIGNHLTLLLLLPAILTAEWYAFRKGLNKRFLLMQTAAISLGLMVYLYLPLQARHYPPINWGNPQSLNNFLWLVTAKPYRPFISNIQTVLISERFFAWFNLLRNQFGALGFIFCVFGAIELSQGEKYGNYLILWLFISYSLFAIIYQTSDSFIYLIPVFLAVSIWIGYAISFIVRYKWREFPVGLFVVLAYIVYLAIQLPDTYQTVNPKSQVQIDLYAQKYLQEAPPHAILFTETDADTFPLWYYHFGLKKRKDVFVIVLPLLHYDWYQKTLEHTYPDLNLPGFKYVEPSYSSYEELIARLNSNLPVCESHVASIQPLKILYSCRDNS